MKSFSLAATVFCLVALAMVPDPSNVEVPVPPMAAAGAGWGWPLAGTPEVTRAFDPPAQRWLPGHRGVDLAGSPGYGVYAAGHGTVRFAGMLAGRPVISIDHPTGLRTTYEPALPLVEVGERVAPGQPIGVLQGGHASCPAAACLHWGLRRGSEYLDPLSLLGLGRVRLLPVSLPGSSQQVG